MDEHQNLMLSGLLELHHVSDRGTEKAKEEGLVIFEVLRKYYLLCHPKLATEFLMNCELMTIAI